MRKEIPAPALIAAVVAVVVVVVGFGWYSINREPPLRNIPGGDGAPATMSNAGKAAPATPKIDVP